MKRFAWLVLFLVSSHAVSAFAFGACTYVFPADMSYLPSAEVCGGKAAIVVMGKYYNSFSVVVRDCNNNDRDPCDKGPASCGSNASSPFKAQKVFRGKVQKGSRKKDARIFCLKEAGDSEVYKLVRRITVKLRDPVTQPSHLLKICLRSRTIPVHVVQILSTTASKDISNTGYTSACKSQPYLACDISYENICPDYD